MGTIIQAIRDSARGEACTIGTGFCNCDVATVVFCHAPSRMKGMGTKSDDWWGAYGCSACHKAMDSHILETWVESHFWFKAIELTMRRLVEKGILTWNEKPKPPLVIDKIVPRPKHFRR